MKGELIKDIIINVVLCVDLAFLLVGTVLAVAYTIADYFPFIQKFFCKIGWHCHYHDYIYLGYDGNIHAKCKWCGYEGLLDSRGNLF